MILYLSRPFLVVALMSTVRIMPFFIKIYTNISLFTTVLALFGNRWLEKIYILCEHNMVGLVMKI